MTAEIAGVPDWMWQEAEAVVETPLRAVESNRPVCIPGWPNKLAATAAKVLPRSLALRLIERAAASTRHPQPE
jgi:short-subunit dehydrogenase